MIRLGPAGRGVRGRAGMERFVHLPGVERIGLPGEMRAARRRDRVARGVPLPPQLVAQLDRLAAETGAVPLEDR